ncbi:phosphohydrolase [candidate division KSB3 bacterium]|uniref:Phosphohydrolase n=1 Tax=candidate division KSB3 bacterium TaxID=2044937 RepID=A0A2G6KHU8_9BACT|nr:MAG: phosphohydrolase [candidate division KSB3 bacterium]
MKQSALRILRTLHDHGFPALWVGGCVRDMLMGKEPGDYDIVTSASPEDVRQIFRRTVPVGVQFGIILVVLKGQKFEVAQFRHATHSTHLEALLRNDVSHRDFTINGMCYDPFADKVYDFVGGQEDLSAKRVRAIVNPLDRFREDRLRMLRAVRFAVSLGFSLDPATFTAIQTLAPEIVTVSAERIREEFLKIVVSPRPEQGLRLLDKSQLLESVLPEVAALKGVQQPPQFHPEGDVFTHTCLMLQHLKENPSPELAMGVLLHDVGKVSTYTKTDRIRFHNHAHVGADMAHKICERFKFSTASQEKIVSLVRNHQIFTEVESMKKSTLKRFLRQNHFADLLELHRVDRLSSSRPLTSYHFCLEKLDEFQQEAIRPPQLLSGKDLIALDIQPGPIFKQILEYIEDAQLEGIVATKQQAIELVEEIRHALG